jgi:hypothetical protein
MTPIQNSIAYIQGFEFGQDIAKKEMRLAVEAEREACIQAAAVALLGTDRELAERVVRAIQARGEQE